MYSSLSPTAMALVLLGICLTSLGILTLRSYLKGFKRRYKTMNTRLLEEIPTGTVLVIRRAPKMKGFTYPVVQFEQDYRADLLLGKKTSLTKAFFLNVPACVKLSRTDKVYKMSEVSTAETRSRLASL